jgi:hypothetical protein
MSSTRFSYGLWVGWALAATCAHAQDLEPALTAPPGEQIISDPELAPVANDTAVNTGDSQIVEDPELAGLKKSTDAGSFNSSGDSTPQVAPSDFHFVLQTRGNHDLKQDDPREEVWESTTLLSIDGTLRRSESLRFGMGFTARYHFASLAHDLPDVRAERYELDVIPTSGYVDVTVTPGLQIRAGYQSVQLGRFDVFSATNVLSAQDLRDGPATMPGRPEIGQIALLIDYTPVSWLSLRAIYVPFFTPHIVSVIDSDYALFPGKQSNLNNFFTNYQNSQLEDVMSSTSLQANIKNGLLRSARERLATSTLSAFIPEPRLNHPQGALRATAHGSFGEVSGTLATALEHFPFFRVSDQTIAALSTGQSSSVDDPQPIRVQYTQFAVASLDASFDVGPVQLGFEMAYQFHRAEYSLGAAYAPDPSRGEGVDPLSIPVPGFTDILQGGARIEYTQNTNWLMVVEAFASYAISVPSDPARSWMFFESGRWLRGVGGIVGYNSDFGLTLQLGAAWLSGPSVVFVPRISYEIVSQFSVEVGAFIIDGQTPPPFATPILAIGGVWSSVDHVFLGARLAL